MLPIVQGLEPPEASACHESARHFSPESVSLYRLCCGVIGGGAVPHSSLGTSGTPRRPKRWAKVCFSPDAGKGGCSNLT
jgi:hypothetical protein